MAYFVRKNSAVYVYFHDAESGKNKPLPRIETKHLDGALDPQVQSWMENYAASKGYETKNTESVIGDKWTKLVDKFLETPEIKSKSYNTIYAHKKYLKELVLVYFVNLHGLNDPYQWTYKSAGLLSYLTNDRKVSSNIAIRCNVSLRAFWDFLIDEGEIHQSIALRLKNPSIKKKATPLQFVLTPEAAINLAKGLPDPDSKLLLLLGYFFSLRPQETFALTRQDFFTKEKAESKECSKVMKEVALYHGLVVNVNKQRTRQGAIEDAKAGSSGFVSCFNLDAATLIVGLVKEFKGTLLPFGNDHYFKKWKKLDLGVTLKDLRRSSIYWIAHNTKLPPVAIKNHARHTKMETTDKYLRRPTEAEDLDLSLDL